ncbi:LacI family DNA-binding transcriptional regulator [Thioclava sp. JM3]|uniref:LacI family DNA-binding transcriptional regulator n=1 Tax=Thioclava sp. JM3 TaxID=1973004 RepID=UPI00197E468F|nr:LacI family DNA-binding transcriptional regulator [Thioclava sp. JM3]
MEIEPKKPVTLREVAGHAGVSAATVSLVLNDKGDISEATRARVLEAVEALNYTPRSNRARTEVTNTIRFLKIARHGQTVNRDHNHFISDYIDGMSFEALRRDYALQVVSYEQQSLHQLLSSLDGSEPRGIVVLGTELSREDIETIIERAPLPTVLIDTYHPFLKANFVDMDNDQLVYDALSHLVSRGFRKIGYVGSYSEVMNFRLRQTAFRNAAAAFGLQSEDAQELSVKSTLDGAYEEALTQLGDRPLADAYFCANDIIAFGFVRALRELGHRVPEDVSVVGFDNLPTSSVFDPPLTSVDVPKARIGAMAIRLLDDLIATDERDQSPVKVLMTGELVVRDSVADFKPRR